MAHHWLPVACLALAVGCIGEIETPTYRRRKVPDEPVTPVNPGTVIPTRIRRLTEAEFNASLASLFVARPTAVDFPTDTLFNGYQNKATALRVTPELARNLWNDVPAIATSKALELSASTSCSMSAPMCARTVLSTFAARAFRRPVLTEEVDELVAVFDIGRENATFEAGLSLALQVIFQSAAFLYQTELGSSEVATGEVVLTGPEIAAQLAYLLTGAPPDAQLEAAGANGQVLTAAVRRDHALRLLATAQGKGPLGTFATHWLEVSRLPTVTRDARFANWAVLKGPLLKETADFFSTAVLDDDARFANLFSARWTVGGPALATFYGASPGAGGRLTLPTSERAGVLTHGSVLAAHAQTVDSSPTRRGYFVRTRLFCQSVSAPPSNLNISLPPPDPTQTTRERFAAHANNAACSGCHQQMDPIGNGLEHYDAIGAFRATDNNKPVDATGALRGTDVDGPFTGAPGLADKVGQSSLARACFAENWLEYATARPVDAPARAVLRATAGGFLSNDGLVRDLIIDLIASELFIKRSRAP